MATPGVLEADLYAVGEMKLAKAGSRFDDEKRTSQDATITDQTIDSDEPTEHEKETLIRIPDAVSPATYLIGVVELAERFSYYGSTVVFTNFIQRGLPAGSKTGRIFNASQRSGALGMGQKASTGLTTFNQFWSYTTPLVGGYIADAHLGRFRTICYSVAIAIVGHILLVISAIPSIIASPHGAIACFSIAVVIMGVGTGGFKSNVSPLIAEQSTHSKLRVITQKNGKRVILDPALTAGRIFMWFYLMVNVGALAGQIGMVYAEKNVGFWLAYLLPTLVFICIVPPILFYGRNRYVQLPPTGSVFGSAFRAVRHAGSGKWFNPKAMNSPQFWDSVKPSMITMDGSRPGWLTWDDAFVDELKRGLKACKVFAWYPLWWLTYNQCNNNLVSQAATMNTHGLPNDLISNLDPIALVIGIPLCDLVIYPLMRKYGIDFTPIKKITWGFLTGALAMLCAAIVQVYIYRTGPCGYHPNTCELDPAYSPLNVWIQTPSYVLIAASEIFASITGLEYAFTKAPKSMRSLVTAVFLFTSAISSALGEAFVPLSDDPLLIWNYGVMGVLSLLGGIGFWFSFRHLDAEEHKLNDLATGQIKPTFATNEIPAKEKSIEV